MPNCSVIGCGVKKCENLPNITLHRLPKNECRKKLWMEVIGQDNLNVFTKTIYVCSLHFEDTCFNRTLNVIKLRDDAVPSRNKMPMHTMSPNKRLSSPQSVADNLSNTSGDNNHSVLYIKEEDCAIELESHTSEFDESSDRIKNTIEILIDQEELSNDEKINYQDELSSEGKTVEGYKERDQYVLSEQNESSDPSEVSDQDELSNQTEAKKQFQSNEIKSTPFTSTASLESQPKKICCMCNTNIRKLIKARELNLKYRKKIKAMNNRIKRLEQKVELIKDGTSTLGPPKKITKPDTPPYEDDSDVGKSQFLIVECVRGQVRTEFH